MVQVKEKEVTPLNDVLFKKVFATQANSHIIMGFLKDIAGINAESVKVIDPYNVDTYSKNKEKNNLNYTEVDLAATLPDCRQITIELQVAPQGYFNRRLFYYIAERYRAMYGKVNQRNLPTKQTKYDSLEPIHSINILNFMLFDDEFPVDHFVLRSKRGNRKFLDEKGAEILIITFFELGKKTNVASNINHWVDFFLKGEVGPDAPDYIKDACEQVRRQNLTRGELEMVNTAEKVRETQKWMLRNSEQLGEERGLKLGLERGIKEGIEQGREEGREEGIEQGIEQGIERGIERGIEQGREEGIERGIEQGREQGIEEGIEQGREQGIEEGIGQGREQGIELGKLQMVRNLKEIGVPMEQMMKASGLTRDLIEKL